MMVGTTFAWFTDTATSGGNIIQTGKLDVKMSYSETLGGTYLDVEAENTPPVFNYANWEPGYSDVKYVKIENEGTLAFKYALDIVPMMLMADGEVDLADVIDVSVAVADGTATSMGTLSEIFDNSTSIATGVLYSAAVAAEDTADDKADEIVYRVTMKMKTSAGREYMGLNVGDGFDLRLYATQYTYEKDSFDDQYDKDADFEKLPVAKVYKVNPVSIGELPKYGSSTNETVVLDTAYTFKAPQTTEPIEENPYKYYHTDFVVTFDQDIAAGSLGLAGSYGSWKDGMWIVFDSPVDVKANEEMRLLANFGTLNYEEVVTIVKEFTCGAYNNSLANVGKTMTVELRLYEVKDPTDSDASLDAETGNYEVIGSYSYTFEGMPDAGVKELDPTNVNEGKPITVYNLNNIGQNTGKAVTLDVAYEFKAPHTAENVAESEWADWYCDYVVSLDTDVKAADNVGGLAGYYELFFSDWIAFDIPADVEKNVGYYLLSGVAGSNPWTYTDVVTQVGTFQCGAYSYENKLKGVTMTVILRLWNPENESEHVDVSTITYTFQ